MKLLLLLALTLALTSPLCVAQDDKVLVAVEEHEKRASALFEKGDYAGAEKKWRSVQAVRERVLGPKHPDTLRCRKNFAEAMQAQGKWAEAEREHREVIALRERALGDSGHPDVLESYYNLARCLKELRKYPEALLMALRAADGRHAALGAEHPDTKKAVKLREEIEEAMKK